MIRAKFLCHSKEEMVHAKGMERQYNLKFRPVTAGSDENDSFWRWTPSGILDMMVISEHTADKFEVGKEYYLDFSVAE